MVLRKGVVVDNGDQCNYTGCKGTMTQKVSTLDVRQRIGDMLNRVSLRHDEFIIERKGQPLAALVPVGRLQEMRRFARRHALEFLEGQAGGTPTGEKSMDIALEAQAWARSRAARHRRKPA